MKVPTSKIPVVVHGGCAHVHRPPQFGCVPDLSVKMRQHPPEASQGFGRYFRAQSRDVPLQKGARKRLHPTGPFRGRARQPGPWKAAAHPETVLVLPAHLGQREAAHVHENNSPRQSLRYPLDQVPGSTAQKQKDRFPVSVVADRAQDIEQAWHALHLVENDHTFALAKQSLGSHRQGFPHGGDLEIQDRRRSRPLGRYLLGQSLLADLPGAQQSHYRHLGKSADNF